MYFFDRPADIRSFQRWLGHFFSEVVKGTVSPAQNRLKVVWLDRPWLGIHRCTFYKFYLTFQF